MKWIVAGLFIWLAWYYLRPKPKPRGVTDEAEARAILGLDRGADADAIRTAHRRLVASVHPDRGGSADLARRVNAARDLLLKRL
ncbi:J domain-containing protein [Sphingomonas ginsenosidivorax]|uniref:J domain-containing protein n=1 Tax=Sphingomonas ginsenosidivorax TaxID=862135 RepID=A0A5C6UGX2_9SPHN|nr:DnaJ domain-containing protein [Sphingomonas ginsenosidivorax]TXC71949.1 J domain-containing protein [Sphingomonas ginsenosidivorax]